MSSIHRISIVIPMFRDGQRARIAAEAVQEQELPAGIERELIIVDDGSDDGSVDHLKDMKDVHLLQLPENQGRAAARNAGARMALGQAIVFLDCDCLMVGRQFLLHHIAALDTGAVASTGRVTGTAGFWDRYQRSASARREAQHARGVCWSGSTQNFAVTRDAFLRAGGFDLAYQRYGFEDRDLLIRLDEMGRIAWVPEAMVQHIDAMSLENVARKMREGAQHSGKIFSARHPDAYRQLGYAAIDTRLHPWLHPPAKLLGSLAFRHAGRLDPWLDTLPYSLASAIVKATTALAYMYGSTLKAGRE
jgi:GT2 family glycosyltransferase